MSSAPGKPVYQAVLLIAFGGPASRAEVRPFVARVLEGHPVAPGRLEAVVSHYEAVGGKSPLNEITARQALALERTLRERRLPLRVYVGMRHSRPFLAETLERMAADGVRRALGCILSPHRSEASFDRYQKDVADARSGLGASAPAVDYCAAWHAHPLFVEALADGVEAALAHIEAKRRPATPLIFTAHSIPLAMAQRSPYAEQIRETAARVAGRLGGRNWSVAYQSRSGRPDEAWLEPDIGAAIRALAARGATEVIAAPIGFVADNVEILYDLDIEARGVAEALGLGFARAGALNDRPAFIRMMAAVIEERLNPQSSILDSDP